MTEEQGRTLAEAGFVMDSPATHVFILRPDHQTENGRIPAVLVAYQAKPMAAGWLAPTKKSSFVLRGTLKAAMQMALTGPWGKEALGIRGAVLWERIKDKL